MHYASFPPRKSHTFQELASPFIENACFVGVRPPREGKVPNWREGGRLWGEPPARSGRKGISTSHPCRCQTGALALGSQLFGNSEGKHSQAAAPRAGRGEGERDFSTQRFSCTLVPSPASPRQLRLPCHLNEDFQKDAGAHKWTETPGVLRELRQSLAGKAESC